jgi:phosphoenolpyruvate-protein kinase (PTS system EI component)
LSILINGIGVSSGIAIGEAYVYSREQKVVREYKIPEAQQKHENELVKDA